MKLHILFFLIFLTCINIFSQNIDTCKLSIKESPALRQLKLGMSEQDVSKIFGKGIVSQINPITVYLVKDANGNWVEPKDLLSETKYERIDIGVKSFIYNQKSIEKPANFEGINFIGVEIYKNSVYRIFVNYVNSQYKWKDTGEFAYILSDKLNLPKTAWDVSKSMADMKCNDFRIFISTNETFSTIDLADQGVSKLVTEDAKRKFLEQSKDIKQNLEDQEKQKSITDLDKKKTFKP